MAKESKIGLWLGTLLGLSGLIVTIVAVMSFERAGQRYTQRPRAGHVQAVESAANPRLPAPAAREPVRYDHTPEGIAELEQARKDIAAGRAEYLRLRRTGKCVHGILFAELDGELRNVGRCDP